MEPFEQSTLQIISTIDRNEGNEKINSVRCNSKTHSALKEKKFIPLYAGDLRFLLTRVGWLVTHIYEHFAFEQLKFKKDFLVMNQKSRQKAASSVEKDFYKLLNNSNFGIDCRDNIDNCILEPLFDDFEEISYIKKFMSILFDETFPHFHSPALVREKIIEEYQGKIFELKEDDPLYEIRKKYYECKMDEELDAVNCFEKDKG